MFKRLFNFIVVFLMLSILALFATQYLNFELSNKNFWDKHGVFFLFFLATFPRLTLLFSNVASGGLIWWLGWIFAPRILVAALATVSYWQQNPILVALAWVIAIGGESSEKYVMVRRSRKVVRGPRIQENVEIIDIEPNR